ncbi:MAG: hypothetical protein E7053_04815 [Lentisphaerae bacterium]|nr:hypothetical protein [Lentisphaerota bacterium]
MADVENTPGASVSLEEDTRTRKTVRLRTLTPKVTGPVLDDVPAEAAGDDVEDTRTRMTVKLKPSAAKPPLTLKKPAVAEDSAVEAEEGAEDTRTRMTVKLKPSAAKPPLTLKKPAVAEDSSAEAEDGAEDTRTRMTVKLKPSAAKPPLTLKKPAVAEDSAAEAEEGAEDTRTRMTVKLKPSAAKPPLTLKKPAADGAVAAEAGAEGEGHTVRLPRPALKKGPGAAAPGMPQQGGPRPVRCPEMNGAPVKENYPADVPLDVPRASGFYMVMTLISLLFLIGTAALTTVHYLNFEHLIEFEIPGIPFGK